MGDDDNEDDEDDGMNFGMTRDRGIGSRHESQNLNRSSNRMSSNRQGLRDGGNRRSAAMTDMADDLRRAQTVQKSNRPTFDAVPEDLSDEARPFSNNGSEPKLAALNEEN